MQLTALAVPGCPKAPVPNPLNHRPALPADTDVWFCPSALVQGGRPSSPKPTDTQTDGFPCTTVTLHFAAGD